MPYITVTTDDGELTWRERVEAADFDTDHFRGQLAERLRWGVADAEAIRVPAARPAATPAVERTEPAAAVA